MSYLKLDGSTIKISEDQQDAFGRLRVSEPYTIFDAKFTYGTEEGLFFTNPNGAGTATFLPNESAWLLSVGTTAGDKVVRESFKSFLYLPGKSHSITMTGVMGAPVTNVRQQIGYFDDKDGVFFEQTTGGLSVVLQTSVTGSVVKNVFLQASWNRDKLDGTGPSGVIIDPSKAQIFIIDFQWLGVGRVRYGFNIAGQNVYCHEINNANNVMTTYMRTAQLPLRYVIENLGITTAPTTLRQICSTVASEGGYNLNGPLYTFYSGNTPKALPVGVNTVVASWRMRPLVSGNPNRSVAEFLSLNIIPSVQRATHYAFFFNPTLTGANFLPSGAASSVVDIDTSATSFTGGESRFSGIFYDKLDIKDIPGFELIPGMIVSLVLNPVVTPSSAWVTVNWREIG
jgi:hypothetical protein